MESTYCGLWRICRISLLAVLIASASAQAQTNTPIVLYSTEFEVAEGYNPTNTLSGQQGWVSSAVGGNGLVADFFEGRGQQAFVGYAPVEGTNDILNVWRPINYVPAAGSNAQVRFSTLMSIIDSSNTNYDAFRWSVYNTNGNRLFSIDFDNYTFQVSYALDNDAGFVTTGQTFSNSVLYELVIDMDFASNRWSALLDGNPLVTAQPLTTAGSPLNLGDVDAVWFYRDPRAPGDNFMLFDDYRVVTGQQTPPPPSNIRLNAVSRLPGGAFLLQVQGTPLASYIIEASPNLFNWIPIRTNSLASDGLSDYLDSSAVTYPMRFYRARPGP